jgi:hypothetical protein
MMWLEGEKSSVEGGVILGVYKLYASMLGSDGDERVGVAAFCAERNIGSLICLDIFCSGVEIAALVLCTYLIVSSEVTMQLDSLTQTWIPPPPTA